MVHHCSRCEEHPGHALLRWGAVLAMGAALEAEAVARKHHEHTFSHMTRQTCRTSTPLGKTGFIAGWVLLSLWWVNHIVKWTSDEVAKR